MKRYEVLFRFESEAENQFDALNEWYEKTCLGDEHPDYDFVWIKETKEDL